MGTIGEEAEAYEPPKTKIISDLKEVSVDVNLHDDSFETTDKITKKLKTVHQKVLILNDEKFRVPSSVLSQLKVHRAENPGLKKFKVKKVGDGFESVYTVIPLPN